MCLSLPFHSARRLNSGGSVLGLSLRSDRLSSCFAFEIAPTAVLKSPACARLYQPTRMSIAHRVETFD